jgi:hypothetical protein
MCIAETGQYERSFEYLVSVNAKLGSPQLKHRGQVQSLGADFDDVIGKRQCCVIHKDQVEILRAWDPRLGLLTASQG